jgi:hypothetical protein
LLRSVSGFPRRLFSIRFKQLEREAILKRVTRKKHSPPGLLEINGEGSGCLAESDEFRGIMARKWYGEKVFSDQKPREVKQVYPQPELIGSYVNLDMSGDKRTQEVFFFGNDVVTILVIKSPWGNLSHDLMVTVTIL